MITTVKILQINLDSKYHKANRYKVEVTIFKRPGDENLENYTFIANSSVMPGFNNCYEVGDVVYITFLNENLNDAIILGKIYQGLNNKPYGYLSLKSVSAQEKAYFPKDTTIGDITYKDLENLLIWKKNIPNPIDYQVYDKYYIIDGGRISDSSSSI